MPFARGTTGQPVTIVLARHISIRQVKGQVTVVYVAPCGNRYNRAYFATQHVMADMHEGDMDAWYQAAEWHAGLFTGGSI